MPRATCGRWGLLLQSKPVYVKFINSSKVPRKSPICHLTVLYTGVGESLLTHLNQSCVIMLYLTPDLLQTQHYPVVAALKSLPFSPLTSYPADRHRPLSNPYLSRFFTISNFTFTEVWFQQSNSAFSGVKIIQDLSHLKWLLSVYSSPFSRLLSRISHHGLGII